MKNAILKCKTLFFDKLLSLKKLERQQLQLFIPMFIILGFVININFMQMPQAFSIVIFAIFYGGLLIVASIVDKRYVVFYFLSAVCGVCIWQFVQKPQITQKSVLEYHKNINITCKLTSIQNKIDKISAICIDVKINPSIETKFSTQFFGDIKKIKLFYQNNDTQNIKQVKVGDIVDANVNLFSLPSKSHYSSYNYQDQLMYSGIMAMASVNAINNIAITKSVSFGEAILIFFKNLRFKISQDISNVVKDQNVSAILQALTVGERGQIDDRTNRQVAISGLSHILSISGLHIAIVSGFFMIFVKFYVVIFAKNFALHYNYRKIGALIAIFGSFFYLALSGFLVPAIRSFIMSGVILLSIISDRKAFTMRNFMLAACVVMAIYPSSVFFASFQLSFSAVMCLIVSFNFLNNTLKDHRPVVKYILAIFVSSAFINIVGMYLSLYHFGVFSVSSVIANILAIPLTSFVIMPFCIMYIFLFTIKLGFLGVIFLKVAQFGVVLMLFIAKICSSQKWFYIAAVGPSDALFYISCFGLLWLAFFKSKIRYLGLLCYIVTCYLYFVELREHKHLLTSNGKMTLYANYNTNYLLATKQDNFTLQTWQQELGIKYKPKRSKNDNITLNNNIVLVSNLQTLDEGICNMTKMYFVLNTVKIDEIYEKYQKCQPKNFAAKNQFFIKNDRIQQIIDEHDIQTLRGYGETNNLHNDFAKWLTLPNNIFCYLDFKFYGTHTILKNSKNNEIIIKKVYE